MVDASLNVVCIIVSYCPKMSTENNGKERCEMSKNGRNALAFLPFASVFVFRLFFALFVILVVLFGRRGRDLDVYAIDRTVVHREHREG